MTDRTSDSQDRHAPVRQGGAAGEDASICAEQPTEQARQSAQRWALDARESALRERERKNDAREQALDDRDSAIMDRESLQEQRDILFDERGALLHDARKWQEAREELVDQREAEWDQSHGLSRTDENTSEASPPAESRHRPEPGA